MERNQILELLRERIVALAASRYRRDFAEDVAQESFVRLHRHGLDFPNEAALGGWVQAPPLQTSFVHALLSVAHAAVLFGWVQAPPLQTSLVQTLPSSVHAVPLPSAAWPQAPALQVSVVQGFESSQLAALVQPPPLPWRGLSGEISAGLARMVICLAIASISGR